MLATLAQPCFAWGFFAHRKINQLAVFLLPPEMMVMYKPNIDFIFEHAADPDKRRYVVEAEGARHYIDIDRYGYYPFDELPRKWNEAVEKFSADTLRAHGIVPWWIQTMLRRLTDAFIAKDEKAILRNSTELGHYIADMHVPLHTSRNHNGQLTNQVGIHGFWESRVPELLAESEWDFLIGKAVYISDPGAFIWARVLESAAAVDSVLRIERNLAAVFPADAKYSFEERNGLIVRQYAAAYTRRYDELLNGMVERRMRQAIFAVASFWYTAWVNAGQPELRHLSHREFSAQELSEFVQLNAASENREHD